MAYRLKANEGIALHYLALALRPEWATNEKGPGVVWQEEIENNTFPYAENFEHCIAALIDYCKASKQGKPVFRYPRPFPDDGDHWIKTAPVVTHRNPRKPCPDHPLDKNNYVNCISCRSEYLSGLRPYDKIGKHYVIADEFTLSSESDT